MLAWVGYQPNATQSPGTLTGLLALVSLVPAGFALAALIAMYFYPLTEAKFSEILGDLQARKTLRTEPAEVTVSATPAD
jgi:GPH family glycoside/pentoside/hexuronide:cation symporter